MFERAIASRFFTPSVDEVRQGAGAVIERTLAEFPEGNPALVFFCSCGARKMYLALAVTTEIEQISNRLEEGIPIAGFYAFGEIGSRSLEAPTCFHNQSIVVVAVR